MVAVEVEKGNRGKNRGGYFCVSVVILFYGMGEDLSIVFILFNGVRSFFFNLWVFVFWSSGVLNVGEFLRMWWKYWGIYREKYEILGVNVCVYF